MYKRKRNQGDALVFNGTDLSSIVYCKVNRPVIAPVKATFETIGGRHGETFRSAKLEGYDLPVDIWLRSVERREVAEARHRLAAALWADEPKPLYLPDDPTRYLLAVVSGDTDLGEITDDCPTTTISFHVGDPVYYGQKRTYSASAGEFAIAVGGTWPAYLTVEATPTAGETWRLTNMDTGEYVEIAQALTASSVIRLDMETERATVNQQTACVTVASDFFEVSDRCRLKLSGGTAKLEWRERWL